VCSFQLQLHTGQQRWLCVLCNQYIYCLAHTQNLNPLFLFNVNSGVSMVCDLLKTRALGEDTSNLREMTAWEKKGQSTGWPRGLKNMWNVLVQRSQSPKKMQNYRCLKQQQTTTFHIILHKRTKPDKLQVVQELAARANSFERSLRHTFWNNNFKLYCFQCR
jgi:hypothetical protein